MRYQWFTAGALLTLCWSTPGLAQPLDPAAANRDLIGNAPNVDIQTSANGTLDVGGAGAANPNVTGGNLRGNLGASVPQSTMGTFPIAPGVGLPNFSFATPDFGPDLRGRAVDRKPTNEEMRIADGLILPRFRSGLGDGARPGASVRQSEGWRYKYFNNRWWYWKSNNSWAYWDGSHWLDHARRQ